MHLNPRKPAPQLHDSEATIDAAARSTRAQRANVIPTVAAPPPHQMHPGSEAPAATDVAELLLPAKRGLQVIPPERVPSLLGTRCPPHSPFRLPCSQFRSDRVASKDKYA
jgi:hypothetical protein